jgi:LysM repeat protein
MTINSIQSTSALQYTDSARRHAPPPMTNTAQLLGLSTSDLSSDLQSGKTLSSLASAAGVSSSDLLKSVETDITANAPQGAPALSSNQLNQMATNMINGTGQSGGHHHHHHGGASATSMSDTADLLGVSTTDLASDLQSGQTLSSLASSAGVSSSDLLKSVESDLTANAPQGASALSSDQLKQMATDLINGAGFGGGNLLSGSSPSGYGSAASGAVAVDQYA